MARRGVDVLVLLGAGLDSVNVEYLTGFRNPYRGDALVVIPPEGDPILITNSIAHGEPLHTGVQDTWLRDVRCSPNERGHLLFSGQESLVGHLRAAAHDHGFGRRAIGVAGAQVERLYGLLARAGIAVDESAMPRLDMELSRIRSVKSHCEIQLMRRAAEVADRCLEAVAGAYRPGVSERELAAVANSTAFSAGADPDSIYPVQVASGPRAGLRNLTPSDRRVEAGDACYVGILVRLNAYLGRIGTGMVTGRVSAAISRVFDANRAMVESGIACVRPGVPVRAVAAAARAVAERAGVLDEAWIAGHGMGLGAYDLPVIAERSMDVFEPGMAFVFEPMVAAYGVATANAERVWLVTADGCECLSRLPLDVGDLVPRV